MHTQHHWCEIWVGSFLYPPAEALIDSTAALGIASLQLHSLVLVVAALVMNVSHGRMCGIAVRISWHREGVRARWRRATRWDWVIHQAMARCIEMLYIAG